MTNGNHGTAIEGRFGEGTFSRICRPELRLEMGIEAYPKITSITVPRVKAEWNLCHLKGASRPHLIKCSDRRMYVVKCSNTPQGIRALANELLGAILAKRLSLPVPKFAIVEFDADAWRARGNPDLTVRVNGETLPGTDGHAFGSRFEGAFCVPQKGEIAEDFSVPATLTQQIRNYKDFWGMLVFDVWTSNYDRRQAICVQKSATRLEVLMIDNGSLFCASNWTLPVEFDLNWHLYSNQAVYREMSSITSLEPWLTVLEEQIDRKFLYDVASVIPPEWCVPCQRKKGDLETLVDKLDHRRARVRKMIQERYFTR